MNARGLRPLIAATVATALIVSGCSTTTSGTPASGTPRSTTTSGTPASGTPRSTTTSASSSATTTTSTTTTAPAGMTPLTTPASIFADVKAYWEEHNDPPIITAVGLVADPDDPSCTDEGYFYDDATAAFCGLAKSGDVVYSKPRMDTLLAQTHGPMTRPSCWHMNTGT